MEESGDLEPRQLCGTSYVKITLADRNKEEGRRNPFQV